MPKTKSKRFHSPGIYHKLDVKVVSQKWLGRFAKDKDVLALYVHDDGAVYVSRDLGPEPTLHCFYHEIAHHIIDTLAEVEEETRCDVLGAYLMRLGEDFEKIKKNLKKDEGEPK